MADLTETSDWAVALAELLPAGVPYPAQGAWTEADYLWLTEQTNRLVEFNNGDIEVLPMPSDLHQAIVMLLSGALLALLRPRGGHVRSAPLRLRLPGGQYREPDVLALFARHDPRRGPAYWTGADLVMEIISPGNPEHDRETKRAEYATAGILEYWIVDPRDESIMVLTLLGAAYQEQGRYVRGDTARSVGLPDFAVSVADVFDAE